MKAKSITPGGDLEYPLPEAANASTTRRLRAILSSTLSHLSRLLLGTNEPHVWFKRDRNGQSWWCAYDPCHGTTTQFTTTTELRAWLERRYYDHSLSDRSQRLFLTSPSELVKTFRHF